MRRILNFVDALRKVRLKLSVQHSNRTNGLQNTQIHGSKGYTLGTGKSSTDNQTEFSLVCNDKTEEFDDKDLKDEWSSFQKQSKIVMQKKEKCLKELIGQGIPPLAPPPDKTILWQNLKEVLLVCGGQKQPIFQTETGQGPEQLVGVLEAQRFVSDIFAALDVPQDAASDMADALVAADYMGHRSMGIHRLPAIAADLLNCTVSAIAKPEIQKENDALALVNGSNAPGPVVATFCMDLAIQKAQQVGIGWVVARKSNCIGMASWYACQAMEKRLIGLCMSNAAPTLVPSGGIEPILGENPIACVAAGEHEQFLVDFGQSSCSVDQLELSYCNGKLKELPPALALNESGEQDTNDVAEALRAQRFYPFRPAYKGFGLAAMVDILCGVMSGAQYANQLRKRGIFSTENKPYDLGQLYVAIDPRQFCTTFEDRLADFQHLLRNAMPCPVGCKEQIMAPGDKELLHMQMVDKEGGLRISPCTLGILQELADTLNMTPLQPYKEDDTI
ncbi:uncharacterized protein Dwil_GK22789 [Drosophila willistoni]|uniref:Uncharacterized protein n=1 Tax=Drosophila willistoni TaxID=7260 RepID=B4NGA8_DROWI|nr:uncharacterized oxidoreductase YjmC [Drosophila willistoni]EDW83325.1 uncharacterized protein Dwil_GK22789 [Drosophila willistoni]